MYQKLLQKALAGHRLVRSEYRELLALEKPAELAALFQAAYQLKLRTVGNRVRLRGLIEVANYCAKNCCYCGIRRDNHAIRRYQLSAAEILEAAVLADRFGYGSVVLQAGEREDDEWVGFITEVVRRIKADSSGRLGITLSLGEQREAVYRQWFEAGAHRYLLRIESSVPELYRRIHPPDHDYRRRLECLRSLRRVGYQVGTGTMSDLPGQTLDDLASDIAFFRELDVDMIGMGPYIPHPDTPLGAAHPDFDAEKKLTLALKMIAVTRLALLDVNIAATTALQTLAADGRERGLLAGANVIMPNVGEVAHRKDYLLYTNKPGLDENAAVSRGKLEASLHAIGEEIAYEDWGDSPHFAARRRAERESVPS